MQQTTELPRALPAGGTIALVSPSWGGPNHLPARYARATTALQRLGYQLRPMPNFEGGRDGVRDWLSGTRTQRVCDLHDAFTDPAVDLVLATIGGNHSAQLVADLDYELIAANPKPFCGYSDITVLLHAIHSRTGMVTFYGPAMLPEFGEVGGPDAEVVSHWQRVVSRPEAAGRYPRTDWQAVEFRGTSDDEQRPRHRVAGERRRVLRPGSAQGKLLAGCLPSVRNLIGTPWQPVFEGRVLVLETPEAPYDVELADADLAHLRLSGVLDSLSGLIIGRTEGWSDTQQHQLDAAVMDAVRGLHYPVWAGIECTHSSPLLTFPIGVEARMENDDLDILEPAVK